MFFDDKSARSRDLSTFTNSSIAANGQSDDDIQDSKRRRIQRACDMCRLKKVRCEGGQPSRRACSNCITGKYDCTYLQTAKHEYRDKTYVQGLERRLVKLEQLLHKLNPDVDLSQDPDTIEVKPKARTSPAGTMTPPRLASVTTPVDADDVDSDDEEITARRTLAENLQNVSLDPGLPHFIGKSSGLMLLHTAIDFKDGGVSTPPMPARTVEKTPAFWDSYTWSNRPSGPRYHFLFPDSDLIPSLIEYYFREYNSFNPLLHRPTFERRVADGLHLSDEGFGATLLLVSALGARFSDDPRVFSGTTRRPTDAGMQWFNQVQATLKVISHEPPRLYDLQIASLAATFLHGLSAPQISWPVLGYGIRTIQALGAHRRKVYNTMPPVERELLKRAFWTLIKTDRELSYHLGRPFAMQDEDFDVEVPIECDDEYWITEDPEQAFKQPKDKPSKTSYFNAVIRLILIQSFALRTIYSTSKSKVQLGHVGPEWEERMVMELDSALNKWVESLPQHLRFDPNQPELTFLNQSVALYATYYNLQMVVHRPFLSPRRQQPAAFPSLAICTNAARSCLHVLDVQYNRAMAENGSQFPQIGSLFMSGLILLLNIWNTTRSGVNVNISKDMDYVHKAMNMLKALEPRWHVGGRMGDALFELVRAGDLPLPTDPASPYAQASTVPPQSSTVPTPKAEPDMPRVVNGHTRTKSNGYDPGMPAPPRADGWNGYIDGSNVPFRTDELGRHPAVAFVPTPRSIPSVQPMHSTPWLGQSTDGLSTVPAPQPALQPELSATATEEFLRTLAGISGDPSGSGLYAAQAVPGAGMPNVPLGGDMLTMWSDVGASLQWDEWGGYLAGFGAPAEGGEWVATGR